MGLDMYLIQRHHNNFRSELGKLKVFYDGKEIVDSDKISYVSSDFAYWRKANHIHKWFVDNVQDGKDDCGTYYVSKETLLKLRNDCEQVLDKNSLSKELLPTASGFFFGSTEYDTYYYDDVKYTLDVCNNALSEIEKSESGNIKSNFYYYSSW